MSRIPTPVKRAVKTPPLEPSLSPSPVQRHARLGRLVVRLPRLRAVRVK